MRAVVTCDKCGAEETLADANDDPYFRYTLEIDGGERLFTDLCPECREQFDRAMARFRFWPDKRVKPASDGSQRSRKDVTYEHKCKEKGCPRSFISDRGLHQHMMRSHKETVSA